jgi:hypothetical protein
MKRTWMIGLTGLALLPAVAVACGDDDGDAVTHEEWFQAVCDKLGGQDPGFDRFFADHPEPTLEDWAAFLPGVVSMMDTMADTLENTPTAPEDEAAVAAAVTAISAVRDNFDSARQAATAGDQAAFDAVEEQNQSSAVPAMEAAMAAVDERDCPGEGA